MMRLIFNLEALQRRFKDVKRQEKAQNQIILSQETKVRLKELFKFAVNNISKKKAKEEKLFCSRKEFKRPFSESKFRKKKYIPWVPNSPDKNEKLRSIYFQMLNNSDVTVSIEQRKEIDKMIKQESLQRLNLHEAFTADLTGQPLNDSERQETAKLEKRARSIECLKTKLQ